MLPKGSGKLRVKPVLRAAPGQKKKAGDASKKPESSPACELERETGFEPATLSLGS